MIIDLRFDYPLRGTILENGARILLRRMNKNNFIFHCRYFDSIDEIISKYRLNFSDNSIIVEDIRCNGMHSDLIEFVLNNNIERKIMKINFYDVKSKVYNAERKFFEMCVSDYEFFCRMKSAESGTFVIIMIILPDWNLDVQIKEFQDIPLRVYDSSANKTVMQT
jgi:hypothetical protein